MAVEFGPVDLSEESADETSGLPEEVDQQVAADEAALAEAGAEGEEAEAESDEPQELQASEEDESEEAEKSEEDEEAAEDESEDDPKKYGKRAQARITKLLKERDTAAQQLQRQQAEFGQQLRNMQLQYQEGLARAEQAARQQALMLRKREEIEQARYEEERYKQLPLSEQIKIDAAKKARSEFEGVLKEHLTPLQEQLEQERAARQQAEEAWKRQQRQQKLWEQTSQGIRNVINKGLDEKVSTALEDETSEMLLAYAGGMRMYPEQAAPKFRRFLERWARAHTGSLAASSKQKVEAGKKVPSAANAKRSPNAKGAAALKKPSWDELQKQGMDYVDWVAQQNFRQ